ncbi:MAG: glycosyltransferase involved in cell wall biosynthesis [Saprospiraceae bacterium]|jgi:glycosyltransferase involved in cell wall biosynthesis
MKILQLTKKFPYPLKDGESIAITNLGKAMNELGCEVTLLSMNTKKHFFDTTDLPVDFNHYKNIYTVEIDNELKWKDAFKNLFSAESYHITRFVSEEYENKLAAILQQENFDVIQLETLYLAPYISTIRKHSNAVVAMRAHNVEHEIWERIAKNTPEVLKKWYLSHLTDKLKRYEIEHLSDYDILVPITERDLVKFKQMGYKNEAKVTPIGVDETQYQPDYTAFEKELSISFIGSLDWMPNLEGLNWFLKNVWPKAVQEFPQLSLHIAGRNTPDWIQNLDIPNIKIHGEVSCAATFVNQHPLTIVPLLSGSGMRAKILEGMALGKVVLTTSVGLEGIDARDKREVLLANTADEFIAAIRYCYEHKDKLSKMGKYAHTFVTNRYDNVQIAQRLAEVYKNYLVEIV